MRAAVMRAGEFVVEHRPDPTPGPGEVLVRVIACGICGSDLHYFHHATDIIELASKLGAPTEEMERNLQAGPILGHEFVCEIVDFAPGARRSLAVGARVCSPPFLIRNGAPVLIGSTPETPGAYAELMTLAEDLLTPVGDDTASEAAALTEPVAIAVHAVNKANLSDGEVAVVMGCGPIGLAVIAVLRSRGARVIVAGDLSPARRELAGVMGADTVVDARSESVVAAAAAAAPGARAVIFENTGARGMLHRLVLEAGRDARVIVTGIAPGEESLIPMVAITKEIAMQFVIYYTPEEFAEALNLIETGRINWRALITGKVSLDGVTQAFRDLQDPERHAKILIEPFGT